MEKLEIRAKTQKIFIAVAGLSEYAEHAVQGKESLDMIKEALLIFVLSKAQMANHEFVIMAGNNSAGLTSDIDKIRSQISSLSLNLGQKDILNIFQRIEENLSVSSDCYSEFVQIILFIGDQVMSPLTIPKFFMHDDICLDFVCFNRNGISEKCVLEAYYGLNEKNPTKSLYFGIKNQIDLFRAISLLTAHPQQRLRQSDIELILKL